MLAQKEKRFQIYLTVSTSYCFAVPTRVKVIIWPVQIFEAFLDLADVGPESVKDVPPVGLKNALTCFSSMSNSLLLSVCV